VIVIRKNVIGVDHIALQVSNLEEGRQFFQELLGFKTKFEVEFEGYQVVMLKAGKVEIEIWEGKAEAEFSLDDSNYGVHHLAIQTKHIDDVVAYMKSAGIEVLADIYEPTQGIREAIVQAPGGVRVQFVEQNVPLLIWRMIKGDLKEN
jgi:4-hydroxyphenylpyruvate dioxygenase-like putative hemolysin